MARFVIDEDMLRSTGRAFVEEGYEMKDVRDHGCRGLGDNSGAGPDQDKALSRLSLPSIPLCAFAALREITCFRCAKLSTSALCGSDL